MVKIRTGGETYFIQKSILNNNIHYVRVGSLYSTVRAAFFKMPSASDLKALGPYSDEIDSNR